MVFVQMSRHNYAPDLGPPGNSSWEWGIGHDGMNSTWTSTGYSQAMPGNSLSPEILLMLSVSITSLRHFITSMSRSSWLSFHLEPSIPETPRRGCPGNGSRASNKIGIGVSPQQGFWDRISGHAHRCEGSEKSWDFQQSRHTMNVLSHHYPSMKRRLARLHNNQSLP